MERYNKEVALRTLYSRTFKYYWDDFCQQKAQEIRAIHKKRVHVLIVIGITLAAHGYGIIDEGKVIEFRNFNVKKIDLKSGECGTKTVDLEFIMGQGDRFMIKSVYGRPMSCNYTYTITRMHPNPHIYKPNIEHSYENWSIERESDRIDIVFMFSKVLELLKQDDKP